MTLEKKKTMLQKELKIENRNPEGLFTYDAHVLRREAWIATGLYIFILLWVLCLKFCNAQMLTQNYVNLSELTLRERFLWDIVPFYTRQNHTLQWLEFLANLPLLALF